MKLEEWERVMAVNLTGSFLTGQTICVDGGWTAH